MAGTVAKLMVDTLAQAGIKYVDGVVGESLNGFTDARQSRSDMPWLHMRHEEAEQAIHFELFLLKAVLDGGARKSSTSRART